MTSDLMWLTKLAKVASAKGVDLARAVQRQGMAATGCDTHKVAILRAPQQPWMAHSNASLLMSCHTS